MYAYEMTEKEAVKGLAIIGLSALGGIAVGKESAKLGVPALLSAVLGLGTATTGILFGQDLLLDAEIAQPVEQQSYPPHRSMEI